MQTDVHLKLDSALVEQAEALGPLDATVDQALREALDPEARRRRRRWIEDNALLIEALAGGASETAHGS
jgi:post-segregation antitoxin (ccd killing protein)